MFGTVAFWSDVCPNSRSSSLDRKSWSSSHSGQFSHRTSAGETRGHGLSHGNGSDPASDAQRVRRSPPGRCVSASASGCFLLCSPARLPPSLLLSAGLCTAEPLLRDLRAQGGGEGWLGRGGAGLGKEGRGKAAEEGKSALEPGQKRQELGSSIMNHICCLPLAERFLPSRPPRQQTVTSGMCSGKLREIYAHRNAADKHTHVIYVHVGGYMLF